MQNARSETGTPRRASPEAHEINHQGPECAPVPSEAVPGAGAEHHRLEGVYGALRAALLDHGLSAEQRAPYTEAAARVVTRQLEFTGAALVPQSE